MQELKIVEIDEGFCRILYKSVINGNSYHYCLQEDWPDKVYLYRCSQPPWFEPEYQVGFKNKVKFERPNGDTQLQNAVNKWIDNYER